jgi:hypothetical protein
MSSIIFFVSIHFHDIYTFLNTRTILLGAENALHLNIAIIAAHFLGDDDLAINAWSSERRVQALTKLTEILNCIDKMASLIRIYLIAATAQNLDPYVHMQQWTDRN